MSEETIENLVIKIKNDEKLLAEGKQVSDCALKVPRIDGSEDKKSGLGRKLARQMFPSTDEHRVGSYIAYGKLLKKLKDAYKRQVAETDELNLENDLYRQARMYGNRYVFEQLLQAPLSEQILNPTPMPVEIAQSEDLEPFFAHMKNGEAPTLPCLEFTRGAYYNDGRIDMCKQGIGEQFIGHLVDSIENHPHVEHFLLGNNIVGDEGAQKIATLMRQGFQPPIKTYYLAGNCFTPKGAAFLASALTENNQVQSLWLKRNPLKAEGVFHLAKMLETNNTIETLDLVNVGMLDEGVKILFESLRQNRSLRSLYIDANGISETGAEYIADYFEYLKAQNQQGLTGLFMSINRLGNQGAELIANAVAGYPHLKRLDLSSNRIQNQGLKILLEQCYSLPSLMYLGIGLYKSTSDLGELPNYFDGSGADLIADFLRQNKTLQIMGMRDVNLREGGLEVIADALFTNYSLLELSYQQFRLFISQELEARLKSILVRNLKQLGINSEQFQSDIKRELKHSEEISFIDSIYRNNMKDNHVIS